MATKDDVYTTYVHIVKSQNKPNVVERSKSMPSLTRRKRERISTTYSWPVPNQNIHLRPPYRPLWSSRQDVPAHHNHHRHQEKTYLGTRRLLESRSGLPEGSSDDGLRTHGGDQMLWKMETTNISVCPSTASTSEGSTRLRSCMIFLRQSPLHDMIWLPLE